MEYRMSPGNKTLTYLIAFALVAGGIYALYLVFHQQNWLLLIVATVAIGLAWLIYYGTARVLLTIDESTVTYCNGFGTRSFLLDEIAGFRRGEKNGLLLVPKSGEKPMAISNTLEGRPELEAWVKERYKDIDAEAAAEVEEEVLHNERYGLTEEERGLRLKQARRIASAGWIVSGTLFVLMFFARWVFEWLILITLIFPLAAIRGRDVSLERG